MILIDTKKVLIKWSEGLKLNIIKIIATKKKKYINAPSNNAFNKNIKRYFKQEPNFKLSNLYWTIFRGKNGIN